MPAATEIIGAATLYLADCRDVLPYLRADAVITDPPGDVLVCDRECAQRSCYWPRPDPGVFTQGRGYRTRAGGGRGWLCGTREIHGCPAPAEPKERA